MIDVTRVLEELVAIPSINPMGRPAAGKEFLETRVTDYLEAWFRSLGVTSRHRQSRRAVTISWLDMSPRIHGGRSSGTSTKIRCRRTA